MQERINPQLAGVGTSALKWIADQKRMVYDWLCAVAVSVWQCTPTDTAHCRNGRVPTMCYDVATPADAEVVPLVEFGVHLERGFGFLSQR